MYQLSLTTEVLGDKHTILVTYNKTCILVHRSTSWLGDSGDLGLLVLVD